MVRRFDFREQDGFGELLNGRYVKWSDFDRLATLARPLCVYLNAHSEEHQIPVEQLLQVKAILHELGEVPCPPKS